MKRQTTIAMLCCVAAAMMTACGGGKQYEISGTIADEQFDGHQVYLLKGNEAVDSATVNDGAFVMSGKVSEPWVGKLLAGGVSMNAQTVVVVESGKISVDVLDDKLSGTPMNDKLQEYMTACDDSDLEPELKSYLQLYLTAPDVVARNQAEHLYDSVMDISLGRTVERATALYNANRDNALGAYAMSEIAETDKLGYAELEAMIADAAPVVKNYEPLKKKMEQLQCIEQTSVGKHYIDVQGVDGKLSDLIDGKLALVDFYASWCGPCRAEIRDNLVPLWAKYKDKGLVIVGLNVWEQGTREAREAAHQKVMTNLGITYPQLVDSTRTATTTYGVSGIPQIMLIGRDGTILARDLRGAAIEEAIIKAL